MTKSRREQYYEEQINTVPLLPVYLYKRRPVKTRMLSRSVTTYAPCPTEVLPRVLTLR